MSFYSKIIDLQKLSMAWDRVKKNRPACGVDNVTWDMFEEHRKEQLKQLNISLENHEYTVMPVRMVTIYKGDKLRKVALYCMRDKVLQQSMASELSKIYDGLFSDCVYAYRPGKSALEALEMITEKIQREKFEWVLRLDIEHFFDTICVDKLISQIKGRIKEEDSLELIKTICTAPSVSDTGILEKKHRGIYQGSAVAPVLSNIYLSEFDRTMEKECDFYIRYSDDIIILGRSRQILEDLLTTVNLLLEKVGLALNKSKTAILPVENGFYFLGYYFNKDGKAIPAKAEISLLEKLETMWLTEKVKTLQDKLKKGAEILGGWEQYFKEDREIASIYEFAVVVYMTQNKKIDILTLMECRKMVNNINAEICIYLCQFWEKLGNRQMMLYEMEDFQGIAGLDCDVQMKDVYMEELLKFYDKLLIEVTEELLVNIMQVYADSGSFNKAAEFMDKISRFHSKYEKRNKPVIPLPEAGMEHEQKESVRFTKEQMKAYIESFVGREDTYVMQEMGERGKQSYVQVMEPLTEEILRRHFDGTCTVGTYVQRNNNSARFMVIDMDVSKKVLLEIGGDKEKLWPYLQKVAVQVGKIQEELKHLGLRGWVEESGYRGYHIWILFTEWVSVRYLNMLQDIIENCLENLPETITAEFFPNKSKLKPGKLGQTIKLPYGYHAKTGRQSCFVDENFRPVSDPGNFIMNMEKYTNITVKRILSTAVPSKSLALKENVVDTDISSFGKVSENVELVLKRCNLMRYLSQKAKTTGYLSHFERLSILYVFGHMGEEGNNFIHKVMEFTLNYQYSVTERFISKLPAKPVSCLKLRDQYPKITAEYGCNCNFNRIKNCYPSPVLHAIKAGENLSGNITMPTSRKLSKEKEAKVFDELNINKRVQDITGKILEMKKQRRGIDKNVAKLEHELEMIFDEAGIDCFEVEFGMLVRRKRQQGYEWVVEI